MIATAPQPVQKSQADTPTYIEVIKAILAETLNAQGLDFDATEIEA